jgi:hypothetical protein
LIAPDDIIAAEYDDSESMLMYRKTIKYSGNSTIHIILLNELNAVDDVREIFEDMNCPTEKCNDKYFAIEVPAAIDYLYIKKKLDELAKEEILDYAESCLSEKHQQTNYLYRQGGCADVQMPHRASLLRNEAIPGFADQTTVMYYKG